MACFLDCRLTFRSRASAANLSEYLESTVLALLLLLAVLLLLLLLLLEEGAEEGEGVDCGNI